MSEPVKKDIHLSIHYPWPIHVMPAYQYLNYEIDDFPHTEKAANMIFSLPMFPTLSETDQVMVAEYLQHILDTSI